MRRVPTSHPAPGRAATDPAPRPAPTDAPAAPALAATAAGWRSRHAGLVHLLPLLPLALGDGRNGFAAPRERLLRLAVHGLGVTLSDPVLAPWLGTDAPAAWPLPTHDAQSAADRQALAAALRAVLQRHLPEAQRADLEDDPLPWLLQRGATLHAEPGRWRVHFDEADTRLRRCGLDRDPGHLPWLGLAVELHYE